jgi:hypothetical protein
VDPEQKQEALGAKSHEDILSLLKELDTIEKRVKNIQGFEEKAVDISLVPQNVENLEPPTEILHEPQPEQPIDIGHRKTLKKRDRPSLIELYKKHRGTEKKSTHTFFTHKKEDQTLLPKPPVELEVPREFKRRKQKEKPLNSTYKLYITEEGTLAGLDIKKARPPKVQGQGTSDQPQDIQEPGFKGKLKRVVKKIVPRATKSGTGTGIGGRIKGILKRNPK